MSGQSRPWCIAKLGLTSHKPYVVGRFFNRSDAEDQLRALQRLLELKDRIDGGDISSSFVLYFDCESLLRPDCWHSYKDYHIQIIPVPGGGFTSYLKTPAEVLIPFPIWCDTTEQAFELSCRLVDKRVSSLPSR